MNFNETLEMNEKSIVEKSKECTYKITHILEAKCNRVPILVLNECLDTACLPIYKKHLISFFLNIDENIINSLREHLCTHEIFTIDQIISGFFV